MSILELLRILVFLLHAASTIPTIQLLMLFGKERERIKSKRVKKVNGNILIFVGSILFYQISSASTYGFITFGGMISMETVGIVTIIRGLVLFVAVVLLKQILSKLDSETIADKSPHKDD